MRTPLAAIFLLICLTFQYVQPVLAKTFRVSRNDGAGALAKALAWAKPGDIIKVAGGSYRGPVIMRPGIILEGGWNKDFTKRDIARFKTVIDSGRKGGNVVTGSRGAVIDGFIVTGGRKGDEKEAPGGAGIACEEDGFKVTNCVVKENEGAGIYCNGGSLTVFNDKIQENDGQGILLVNGCRAKIRASRICNNKMAGMGTNKGAPSLFDIRQNVICRNGMEGIEAEYARGDAFNNIIYENKDAGVKCVLPATRVINNTIVGNTRSGIIIEVPESMPVIMNNIIAENMESGIRGAGKGYSYNLLFANSMTGNCDPAYLWCVRRQFGGYEDEKSYPTHHNMIMDPLFTDPARHDYHLSPDSPAIDHGNPGRAFFDTHFPPSHGSNRNDIGAFGGPWAITRSLLDHIVEGPSKESPGIGRIEKAHAQQRNITSPMTSQVGEKASTGPVGTSRRPVAHAGKVISDAYVGDTITLFGGSSTAPAGTSLSYHWEITFRPQGSQATLASPDTVSPTLTVDAPGCFAVELVVSDGKTKSAPDTIYICTANKAPDGKRRVPEQYPTIQTAIDSAEPGDEIVVQKGVYHENVVIDKNIDLTGICWPVIDGGGKEGDVNAVMIAYLGNRAGKIHGFIITGGGKGHMGHGINIWDSSPEVFDNQVMGNGHVGIGIHGRGVLTSDTKVHDNIIHDNLVGIGNGRNGTPLIYHNRIYNNKIAGIGCMGLAAPRIKANDIHDNFVGIGCREVSAPYITDNTIHKNVIGIVISPVSTIRRYSGQTIRIHNNLIFSNLQSGISVSSLNLSKIVITSNTIDSNNQVFKKKEMAGGVVLGYPSPGSFEVILENNIITRNETTGVVNYTGPEILHAKGATVLSRHNDYWGNQKDSTGFPLGEGDISKDPGFVSLRGRDGRNAYYLAHRATGQPLDSPCLNAGTVSAEEAGLSWTSTRVDGKPDTGKVDMGYHYPTPAYD